jgi:excisionase family DNA binding protein
MREFADVKWGTAQPIIVRNSGVGLGISLIQGFGTYSFQVSDPQQFVTQIVGASQSYSLESIENRLRAILLSKLQDILGTTTETQNVLQLIGLVEELGAAVKAKAQDDFAAIGLMLKTFYIASLKPSEKSADELRAMGMLDMNVYTQLQAADALRDAAKNPSGGAGLTAGIGAGVGLGNIISNAYSQNTAQNAQQAPAASQAAVPAIMTPADVAKVLSVTEADVLASIESGELKARKIGSVYRITKESLDEFLKG